MSKSPIIRDLSLFATLPVTHQATIPESYRDIMGHMNVMWYTHLFDTSVYGFFKRIGMDIEFMQNRNGGSFALESHTRYLAEVRVGEIVEVRTRAIGRSQKRFHLMGFLVNLTNQNLASTFEVVGSYIDMSTRRMAPIPAEIAEEFDVIASEHATLTWSPPYCDVMGP